MTSTLPNKSEAINKTNYPTDLELQLGLLYGQHKHWSGTNIKIYGDMHSDAWCIYNKDLNMDLQFNSPVSDWTRNILALDNGEIINTNTLETILTIPAKSNPYITCIASTLFIIGNRQDITLAVINSDGKFVEGKWVNYFKLKLAITCTKVINHIRINKDKIRLLMHSDDNLFSYYDYTTSSNSFEFICCHRYDSTERIGNKKLNELMANVAKRVQHDLFDCKYHGVIHEVDSEYSIVDYRGSVYMLKSNRYGIMLYIPYTSFNGINTYIKCENHRYLEALIVNELGIPKVIIIDLSNMEYQIKDA